MLLINPYLKEKKNQPQRKMKMIRKMRIMRRSRKMMTRKNPKPERLLKCPNLQRLLKIKMTKKKQHLPAITQKAKSVVTPMAPVKKGTQCR